METLSAIFYVFFCFLVGFLVIGGIYISLTWKKKWKCEKCRASYGKHKFLKNGFQCLSCRKITIYSDVHEQWDEFG